MTTKGRKDRLANEGISRMGHFTGFPTLTQMGKRISKRHKGSRRASKR